MKTLYNADESLNSDGHEFERRVLAAFAPLVAEWEAAGFSRAELFHAVFEAVGTEISFKRLVRRYSPKVQ